MKDPKTINGSERLPYVPSDIKVMEITSQGIICTSGSNEGYSNNNNPDWFN